MFPRIRERLGTAALDRLDLLVELSTLGEYGLAEDGLPLATGGEILLGGEASTGRASKANAWERGSGCLVAVCASAPPRLRDDCASQPAQPPVTSGRRRVWQARP